MNNIMSRDIKMIVFDIDGVLVDIDSSWQLIHDFFGVDNEENLHRYLDGEIGYKEFVRLNIRLWGRVHVNQIKSILCNVDLMMGAEKTIKTLKETGFKTAIISSGISILADRVKDKLGINYSFANRLLVDEREKLTGEGEEVVTLLDKSSALRELVLLEGITVAQCAIVGDSRFDASLCKAAGFSIAFNAKDDVIRNFSDIVIEGNDLTLILPYFINIHNIVKAKISLNYVTREEAETITESISPDNISMQTELSISTLSKGTSVITNIYCKKGLNTLVSTLDDLLSCVQVAEQTFKIIEKTRNT